MALVDWTSVQTRLHTLGFDPGPVDGIRGRRTMRAVKRFQESRGLLADGIVGPVTFHALVGAAAAGDPPALDRMPWYQEALRLVGTREIEGPASNGHILEMAERLDVAYENDDIPWCGLFAGHCVGASLPDEVLPSLVLRARAWEVCRIRGSKGRRGEGGGASGAASGASGRARPRVTTDAARAVPAPTRRHPPRPAARRSLHGVRRLEIATRIISRYGARRNFDAPSLHRSD